MASPTVSADPTELANLMRTHRAQVVRYAMRVCISPADAEDATQETLIALTRYVGAVRHVSRLSSWMFTVVRNHCVRLARRSLARTLSLDDVPEPAVPAEEPFVDEVLRGRLAEVIAGLEPDFREVLVRRDLLGHSAREVTQALGLSLPAMKSRLHRARAQVRARLLASLDRAD